MKKVLFILAIVFAFGIKVSAQDVAMIENSTTASAIEHEDKDNFERFTKELKIQAREKSAEYLNLGIRKVALSSGIIYNHSYYWKIRIRANGRTKFLFFQSDTSFSNIQKKECRLEPLLELAKKE